jgi:hypothetical protein
MAGMTVAVLTYHSESSFSPQTTWRLALGGSLSCIALTSRLTGLGFLRTPIAVLWVIWVFHFGLIAAAAIDVSILDRMPAWASDWLFDDDGIRASYCGLLFIICYATGTYMRSADRPERTIDCAADFGRTSGLRQLAFVASCVGLAVFTMGARNHSIAVFGNAYFEFFEVHNAFSWGVVLTGYGGALLIASRCPPPQLRMWIAFVYAPLAAALFLAGARSASVATGFAMVTVAHRTGIRIPRFVLIGCVVGLLTAISLVKESRAVGIRGLMDGEASFESYGPIGGLIELGGSLRPVAATIGYVDAHGLFWGRTYTYPFVRQAQRIVGAQRP